MPRPFSSTLKPSWWRAATPPRTGLPPLGSHYGITALYSDYRELLDSEKLDIVAIASRAELRPPRHRARCGAGRQGRHYGEADGRASGGGRPDGGCLHPGGCAVDLWGPSVRITPPLPRLVSCSTTAPSARCSRSTAPPPSRSTTPGSTCSAGPSTGWWGAAEDEAAVRNGEEFSGFGLIQFQDDVSGFRGGPVRRPYE